MAPNSDEFPKAVTVKEVFSDKIIVQDKNGRTRSISPITSGKGLPPVAGEVWIMVKVSGSWMLDSCVTPTSWVNPAGMVANFAGNTPPEGWVWCDGSSLSRRDYSDLYAAIGDAYGSPTGGVAISATRAATVAVGSPASSSAMGSWGPAAHDVAVVAVAMPSSAYVTSVVGNSYDWVLLHREILPRLSVEVWEGTRSTAPTTGAVTVNFSMATPAIVQGALLTGVNYAVSPSGRITWGLGLAQTASGLGATDDVPSVRVIPEAEDSIALGWAVWLDPSATLAQTYGTIGTTSSIGVGLGLAGAKMTPLSAYPAGLDAVDLGGSRFSTGASPVPWSVVALQAVPSAPRQFVLPTIAGVGGHQAIIATGGSMLVPGP